MLDVPASFSEQIFSGNRHGAVLLKDRVEKRFINESMNILTHLYGSISHTAD